MIKHQTTYPGCSENTKQSKSPKDLHVALILKQQKPKIKILKRARGKKKRTLSTEDKDMKYSRHLIRNHASRRVVGGGGWLKRKTHHPRIL